MNDILKRLNELERKTAPKGDKKHTDATLKHALKVLAKVQKGKK